MMDRDISYVSGKPREFQQLKSTVAFVYYLKWKRSLFPEVKAT